MMKKNIGLLGLLSAAMSGDIYTMPMLQRRPAIGPKIRHKPRARTIKPRPAWTYRAARRNAWRELARVGAGATRHLPTWEPGIR